jgi:hypothetical protein
MVRTPRRAGSCVGHSQLKYIFLLCGFAFAPALSLAQFPVTRAPDFRHTRELKVLQVVIEESNRMWGPRILPDGKKLLRIFARAESSVCTKHCGSAEYSGNIQMSIELDGTQRFVNFNFPLPDGSRPYTFDVSPNRPNEIGTPVYSLSRRDARRLGVILNALKSQTPIPQ